MRKRVDRSTCPHKEWHYDCRLRKVCDVCGEFLSLPKRGYIASDANAVNKGTETIKARLDREKTMFENEKKNRDKKDPLS